MEQATEIKEKKAILSPIQAGEWTSTRSAKIIPV